MSARLTRLTFPEKESFLSEVVRKLREADESEKKEKKAGEKKTVDQAVKESTSSIDRQIKKFLSEALREATLSKNEGVDVRSICRRLVEADEDEEDNLNDEKKTLDDIDVGSYAEAVSRLVYNFSSLIEVRDTLVEMSKVVLEGEFDESTISAFEEVLEEEYDIEVGESRWDKELENQPPPGERAGPTD